MSLENPRPFSDCLNHDQIGFFFIQSVQDLRNLETAVDVLSTPGRLPDLNVTPPSRVSTTKAMFFDMLHMTLDDIKKDGNGKYRDRGRWAYVYKDGKRMERERLFDHKLLNKDQIMLVKQYYKHVDHPDFS